MRAIQISEFGGPEVLTPREVAEPRAADGQVAIAVSAAGVNYADTHKIEQSYVNDVGLPLIPGTEVVGIAADGRRIAALLPDGGYAERAVAHPAMCWEIPGSISGGYQIFDPDWEPLHWSEDDIVDGMVWTGERFLPGGGGPMDGTTPCLVPDPLPTPA